MKNKYHNIAIALAGVCQSSLLVTQLANTGVCNSQIYTSAVQSLFNTSPKTTLDVYGELKKVKTGLEILTQVLSHSQKNQIELIRYLFSSLAITSKLLKNQDALNQIQQRLTRISSLYPEINEDSINEHVSELSYSLAGIYSDIISPLSAKIKVVGNVNFLQNLLVQAKVRTCLFSCVRSSTLWYQIGGKRMQFLFSRNKIRQAAVMLLQEIDKQEE